MQYTYLGRTGLQVSRLCLGTMNFGPRTDEPTSHAVMDRALAHGLNFFDTANVYGRTMGAPGPGNPTNAVGATEEIIGRWFEKGGQRRDKVVLATKVYGKMGDWPNQGQLSALNIRRACEASLRRLKTDYIDLYQMHHIDRATPWEEIWQAMEQLVREGKVLYVGSSNFAGWHIAQANEQAKARHFLGLVSEQSLYNLTERTVELEVLPACEAYGLGFIPWSPLGGGFLGGILGKHETVRRASEMVRQRLEKVRPRVEQYEALCASLGLEPATVALTWLLSNPRVTAPIIGPRTLEQLDDSLKALEAKLTPDILQRLDEIFPGPGGPAPEAYAW